MTSIEHLVARAHTDLMGRAYRAIEARIVDGAYVRVYLWRGQPRVIVWALASIAPVADVSGIPVDWHVVTPSALELRVRGFAP